MEADYLSVKPQTRDLSHYESGLSDWVCRRLADRGPARLMQLHATSASANGFAGESFTVDVERGGRRVRYLLKRKPTRHKFFPEHDFAAEYQVQAVLSAAKLAPVAPVFAYEEDPGILGSPFYLMEFIDGLPVPDNPPYYRQGWLADASTADQHAISASGLAALAALHSAPLAVAGADFLARGKEGAQIDWDLALWDRFCAVAWSGAPMGQIPQGRDWLERNKPSAERLVISWGDARPGNMLFKGTRCAAIIDWDMASAGDPEKDLGYLLAMDLQAERSAGGARLAGWPSRKEMVALYEEAAGRTVDQRKLRFHRIFAAFQIACMYARFLNLRRDLDEETRAQFLNEKAPPIDLMREELEAAHLPGDAT